MRVIHVISGIDMRGGGPISVLFGMANALRSHGVGITVVATWMPGADLSLAEQMRGKDIDVELVGPCTGAYVHHPDTQSRLERAISSSDVVHIHGAWEEIQHLAARDARRVGVSYVITSHGMLDPWSLKQKWFKKWLYLALRLRKNLDRASAIHFTSESERRLARPLNLKPPAIVEPIGVDLSEFDNISPAGAFRSRYSCIGDRPLILFLGRIHPGKGLEYLIPAMAEVCPKDAVLAVVGSDSCGYQSEMEVRVKELGLQRRVVFTGALHGVERASALSDADIFSLPSDHENFGVAIIESLAAGTPVVISNQVGICDGIAAAGVGGVVPTDIKILASELTKWLMDENLRNHAMAKARSYVSDEYDWSRIADRWIEHYSRIIRGK